MSITLNVSGKIFQVSRETLCKSELFDNMLTDCEIDSEIIMMNRSAKLFKHVYAFLLDDKYPYPRKYYSELDYYLVPYDIDLLYDPHRKIEMEISQLKKNQIAMMHQIIESVLPQDVHFYKECAKRRCHSKCESHAQLCNLHVGYCCYWSDEDIKFCEKNISHDRAYCDEHVLSYFE
jgi:hypothetical protein